MKKVILIFTAALVSVGCMQPLSPQHSTQLIRTEIRKTIGKPTGEITREDYRKITELSVKYSLPPGSPLFSTTYGITDLSLLGEAKNLEKLVLRRNCINDLSPLSGLNELRELSLSDNRITDLSALKGLTKLEHLTLNKNKFYNIEPLKDLNGLRKLDLSNNWLSALSALEQLTKLESLTLNNCNWLS